MLAEVFANRLAQKRRQSVVPLTETLKRCLSNYNWPGNIRELQNVIERAFITSLDGRSLNLDKALPDTSYSSAQPLGFSEDANESPIFSSSELKHLERSNIERALSKANGRISGSGGAAELLGIHPNTLASRMRSLGIKRK